MALKIRLTRVGTKKRPVYRLVVSENLRPRDSKFIDFLGYYNPLEDDQLKNVDEDKILHWLQNGATPTETAKSLIRKAGIYTKLNELKQAQKSDQVAEKAGKDAADAG